MENRNPFLLCIIGVSLSAILCLTICVMAIIFGEVVKALIELGFVCIDLVLLGWCICKFNDYKKFLERKKEIDKQVVDFLDWLKNENSEPFKEFEDNAKS